MAWLLLWERNNLLWENPMPEAPGFMMPGRVQLAGSWPADSGGIHYSDGPTPFKAQEEGSAPLAFVQWCGEERGVPPVLCKQGTGGLLEEMWPSQLVRCWRHLGQPGCLVKLIITVLTLQKVTFLVNYVSCYFLTRVVLFAFLPSALPIPKSLGKAAGGFAGHTGSPGR